MEALRRIRSFLAMFDDPPGAPEIIRPTWKDRLLFLVQFAGTYAALILFYLLAYRLIMPPRADPICVQLVGYAAAFLSIGAAMLVGALHFLWLGWQIWTRQVIPLPGARVFSVTPVRRGARARLGAASYFLTGAALLACLAGLLITEPSLRSLHRPCAPRCAAT